MVHSATRQATFRAMLLILIGSIGMQLSAALAVGLFPVMGVLGATGGRMAVAAVLLLVLFRPRLRGRSKADWRNIVLYGVAMAAMNGFMYLAIARIPLGIATTIDFLGPCLVALFASRGRREMLLAVAALVGVACIAGFGGPFDGLGLLFAAAAGACFGAYTLLAARMGQSSSGLPGMALSVCVAAILMAPLSVPALVQINLMQWGVLALSALLGTALAFSVDTLAGKLTSARVLGVFFAFDPVMGTLLGALLLGQTVTLPAVFGIALVVTAGAGIVWFAGARTQPETP